MPKRWAPLQLIGDAAEASVFIRFARRQWEALLNSRQAQGKKHVWRSWAPRSGVRVRVQVNPDKITIWAESQGFIYYMWLQQTTKVQATPTLYGYPPSFNNEIRTLANIGKTASNKILLPYVDSTMLDPDKAYWWYRLYGYHPNRFMVMLAETSTLPAERLNPTDYGDFLFLYTQDSGENWHKVPFAGTGVFGRYIGEGVDGNGAAIGRWLFYTGAGAASKIYYTTDDPDVLLLDTFTTNSTWTIRWLGGTTIELLEYYQNYFVLASSAIRYVSHDSGNTWTGDVGYPGSYASSVEVFYACVKLSGGTFLAVFPDTDGSMYCWHSDNGTSGWDRRAKIADLPIDGYPWYPDVAGIGACENNDAILFYQRQKEAADPDDPYSQYFIWAIKDFGNVVDRRPEPFTNIDTSSNWPGPLLYVGQGHRLNLLRTGREGESTADNVMLAMLYRDGNTFDETFENGSIFHANELNPSQDDYFIYSTGGGADKWRVGALPGRTYEATSGEMFQHGVKKTRFDTVLSTGWGS